MNVAATEPCGTVLVLGGGGFIGRHVVRTLSQTGHAVRAVDRHQVDNSWDGVEWFRGDVHDPDFLSVVAEGCDVAVLLAAGSAPGRPSDSVATEVSSHVAGTVRTAETCIQRGVRRLVFASSGGAIYGTDSIRPLQEQSETNPRSPYGVSKLAVEHYLRLIAREKGVTTVSLRIANPYGEGQRANTGQGFVAAAMWHAFAGRPLVMWGDGSATRDFIHIDDVARAFLAACCHRNPPAVVNIGTGQGCSLLKVAQTVEEVTGRKLDITFAPARHGDVHRNVLDVSRAEERLQWVPLIGLGEGLSRTARWWHEDQESNTLT